MAARLRTLHALRGQSLQIHHPYFRARALLAVLRAGLALDRELSSWPEPRPRAAWAQAALAPFAEALELLPASPVKLVLLELVTRAAARRSGLSLLEARRLEALRVALRFGTREGWLLRVALAVETELERLPGLFAELPSTEQAAAQRLARSGVYSTTNGAVFVGWRHARPLEHFEPSLAMLLALARRGRGQEAQRVLRSLAANPRRRLAPLGLAAGYIEGDASCLTALRALSSSPLRDRALELLVEHELGAGQSRRAEHLAFEIGAAASRQRALYGVVSHGLRCGMLRRELLKSVSLSSDLPALLLRAEHALFLEKRSELLLSLRFVVQRLRQQQRPEPTWVHPALECGAWQRALRLALALAFNGYGGACVTWPIQQAWPLLERSELEAEISSELARARPRLESLTSELPDNLKFCGDWLQVLALERRLLESSVASNFVVPVAEVAAGLRAPQTSDEAFVAGALYDPRAAVEISDDACSALRSAFDLGVAISPESGRRRAVLLRAARAAFKSSLGMSDAAFELRLRMLSALGAAPLAELLAVIAREAGASLESRRRALIWLGRHDAQLALRALYEHYAALTDGGMGTQLLFGELERAAVLPQGSARAFTVIEQRLVKRLGDVLARRFWPAFAGAWLRGLGSAPSLRALRLLARTLRDEPVHEDGEQAFALLTAHIEGLRNRGVEQLFGPGAKKEEETAASASLELEWLLTFSEPYPNRPWPPQQWRSVVDWARQHAAEVDRGAVLEFAESLRLSLEVRTRLLAGAPPLVALEQPLAVDARHSLHFLDKRRDFLAFLRVADCVPCCFASDGEQYTRGMENLRWVYRLWQDPLSFALHLRVRGQAAPIGFVFGGFALSADTPRRQLLVLNGIYLKHQREQLRFAILKTLEEHLAQPLGASELAIAARHGGRGPLPQSYRYARRNLTRLRALRSPGGALERATYDDISSTANVQTSMDLYFRQL
jgi:hypothetical protein